MQTLNGNWQLALDPDNEGRDGKWFDAVRPEARPAPVPGIVQQVYPAHQGVAWYWHTFSPTRLPGTGERCLLRFGAVEYLAEVWLNGLPAGGHEGAETPFELDVTDLLRAGENFLAVRVVKPGNERVDGLVLAEIPHRNQNDTANFQPGQMYNIAGITGRVELLVVPAVRIADIFARPDPATGRIDVSITVRNDSGRAAKGKLTVLAGPAGTAEGGHILETTGAELPLPSGHSVHELAVTIANPRLWDLDDPFLYRLTARLGGHELSVRCGFRDFRVGTDGYFRLNGRRVFLRSSHTGNHFPVGQIIPVDPDHLRRDLILAKASGFNCIRWIAGVALPEQMDFCDELGLMVYEESYAAWLLGDSPHLTERYERSYREMILRDRNHPSVTIWGLINEMADGPAFRCAVNFLPKLRELDPTRLVLLASGRWDADPKIGSVANPGSGEWEPVWGVEGPDAPAVDNRLGWDPGGYIDRAGDAHFYPPFPTPERHSRQLRTLGHGSKPVFLSEGGVGSQHNAIEELRGFDRLDVPEDIPDRSYIRRMAERFTSDWQRFGMDGTYPFPVDFFRDSYRLHSRQRRLFFDLVRSNPRLCGYNLTGLLDHGLTGEGLWSFWRRWKPGIAEVLEDGWSTLRWCLFVSPAHGYAGAPVEVEAVLANEGVLRPGTYPVAFRIWSGDGGIAWEKRATVEVPVNGALALPVLKEQLPLALPAGEYVFAADLERGGAPTGDRLTFKISNAAAFPRGRGKLFTWGVDERACAFLTAHGYSCAPYAPRKPKPSAKPRTILLGDIAPAPANQATWDALRQEIEAGAQVIALSADPFRTDLVKPINPQAKAVDPALVPEPHPWHDLLQARSFHDWLYHRECVGKRDPIFSGLQSGGILDWEYWGEVVGHSWFAMPQQTCEVMAAGFAVGYSCPGGYDSGLLIGRQRVGKGTLLFNSLAILEQLGRHPAAERLLLNILAAQRDLLPRFSNGPGCPDSGSREQTPLFSMAEGHVDAIYRSAQTGEPVKIKRTEKETK